MVREPVVNAEMDPGHVKAASLLQTARLSKVQIDFSSFNLFSRPFLPSPVTTLLAFKPSVTGSVVFLTLCWRYEGHSTER
jgi:hypothetical protein